MSAAPADFWDTLPLGRGVESIVRDANGLAAFAKPAGVLSHPNETADQPRSLLTSRYDREGEYFEWNPPGGGTRRLWLLNRLDAATSGVIMTASSEALAEEIRAMFQRKQVYKAYQALVFGQPRPQSRCGATGWQCSRRAEWCARIPGATSRPRRP